MAVALHRWSRIHHLLIYKFLSSLEALLHMDLVDVRLLANRHASS